MVATVDAYEDGGEALEHGGVEEGAGVDRAQARQIADQSHGFLLGILVIAADEDVALEVMVEFGQMPGAEVMEGGDDTALGEEPLRFLGRGAVGDPQRFWAAAFEGNRGNGVDDELAAYSPGQGGQHRGLGRVGDGEKDCPSAHGGGHVPLAGNAAAGELHRQLPGRLLGASGVAGTDDHRMSRSCEAEGEAGALGAGAADEGEGKVCAVGHGERLQCYTRIRRPSTGSGWAAKVETIPMMPPPAELMQAFVQAVNRNEPVALVNVVRSHALREPQGTGTPPAGTKMVVWEDGRALGSFGEEWDGQVLADARTCLSEGISQAFIYPKAARRTRRVEESATFEVYVEVVRPPTLLVVGGGHVGGFVAKLGKMVGFQVAVLDDRPEFANRERFPGADQIICEDFIPALQRFPIDETTYVVVVTRGHKQDEVSVRTVVDSPAAYIGMIGSKRRAGAVMKLLLDSGVSREALARVHSPIGLDIHAETPEEIAVSIIAEIIMTRLGGTGRPLAEVERLSY